ncbi:MAG: amidohydrolase [Alphaproteobacteria bacterium]|nr:amidohydrolase [Alphaproteobacteria bacterium]|tara:strand:- start:14955 stop:16577 length:1623 start_codon:yes stop_codon:yes gene_type:complete
MSSADVRASLDHPIVDADGHMLEFTPVFLDHLKVVGGPELVERFVARSKENREAMWYALSPEKRAEYRLARPPWWAVAARNTMDRATSMLPNLMKARLDEFGFDFCISYPTLGFFLFDEPDDELRQASCRAQNNMVADIFSGVKDRITPAATVPSYTPEEAISELEHVVNSLGLKAVMLSNLVRRVIPKAAGKEWEGEQAEWIDPLALDSEYDYDPVWQKCMELGVAPTAHSFMQGAGWRRSHSCYAYNQTGHFADAGEAFSKALFFGGVTNRFPELNFGVLEGGVGYAITVFATLIEVWHKRGAPGIANLDPSSLNYNELRDLFTRYGGDQFAQRLGEDERIGYSILRSDRVVREADKRLLDEYAPAGVESDEDIRKRFVDRIWFGCEADDVMTPMALHGRGVPLGAKVKATFGSDIGHWDVQRMNHVLEEAYEMVEDGLASEEDFRDFTFTNPVTLHAGMNPKFFKGTVVEEEVDQLLEEQGLPTSESRPVAARKPASEPTNGGKPAPSQPSEAAGLPGMPFIPADNWWFKNNRDMRG